MTVKYGNKIFYWAVIFTQLAFFLSIIVQYKNSFKLHIS